VACRLGCPAAQEALIQLLETLSSNEHQLSIINLLTNQKEAIYGYSSKNISSARFIGDDLIFVLDERVDASIINIDTPNKWNIYNLKGDFLSEYKFINHNASDKIVFTGYNVLIVKTEPINSFDQSIVYYNSTSYIPEIHLFFKEQGIQYFDYVPPRLEENKIYITSRNQQLKADEFEVRALTTNAVVSRTGYALSSSIDDKFSPIFWTSGDQAVIYARSPKYVVDGGGIGPRWYEVPQPILLLRVPQQITPAP
jgi:hypothetical protein